MSTPTSEAPPVDSSFVQLRTFLEDYERLCARGDVLPARVLHGQGYHTTLPNGSVVRSTRDAADYALGLLAEGSPDSVERAVAIWGHVVAAQDTHPCNRTFGLWPWFFDESLEKMNPPDWNWADFIGVRLAHALGVHGNLLPAELRENMKRALHFAAMSIFRRNMGPDYTNIAVKGGVVAVMAGEQLGDDLLLAYGRERLSRFLGHTERQGGFTEYNSPPYGALVLVEVERGLLIIKDPAARTHLAAIHAVCWRGMAASFHPQTGQLCGPHARAYDDALSATHAALLGAELGEPLFEPAGMQPPHEGGRDAINLLLIPRVPCPDTLRRAIFNAPATRFVRHDYVRHDDPEVRRCGAMWFDGDACLGSINVENLWQQRRPVLGYWKTEDTVAILRVRLTHGGKDFASGVLRTAQEKGSLISCCSLVTNKADSHDHMDMPADGVFRFDQLALCVELTAPGAHVHRLTDGRFQLSAGGRTVIVAPLHAEFGDYSVTWDRALEEGKASVRAVINDGAPVELRPAAMRNVAIAFYLSLDAEEEGTNTALSASPDERMVKLAAVSPAGRLALECPRHPLPLR